MGSREMRSYQRTLAGAPAWALLGSLVAGCSGRVVHDDVVIGLSDATSCRPPDGVSTITLRALGDVPSSTARSIVLVQDQPVGTLGELGYPALALSAEANGPGGWTGVGYRRVGDRGDELLLLPPALSCGLADSEARAPEGAALAVTRDGALVIAGGLEGGVASRRVAILDPGATSVEMGAILLRTRTAFASATGTGDGRVVIAGGAIDADAPAYDTYEEIDPADPTAEPEGGLLSGGRCDHGAILLRDGRIALVGGRAAGGGAPLDTIELVDRDAGRGALARSRLASGLVAPTLALDDRGRVWIAGATSLERFDPAADTITAFNLGALEPADAVAFLPGGRLAWIAGDLVHVILLRDEITVITAASGDPIAPRTRAVATPGGQLLVVGADSFVADPGRGDRAARETSIEAESLAILGDRSIVEISRTGAALRREDEPGPHLDPPATIVPSLQPVQALADPIGDAWTDPAWEVDVDASLVAQIAGARVDVRALRSSRMDVVVRGSGLELVVVPDRAPEIAIVLDDAALSVGGCSIPRAATDPIGIDPGRVTVAGRSCAIDDVGAVGIAVRARAPGATILSIAIARR